MIRVCVKVFDGPFGQHSKCTYFWGEIQSVSLDDFSGLICIFSACKWFSIWYVSDHGLTHAYSSESGFDYRVVDRFAC